MTESAVTLETVEVHGLSRDEFDRIQAILGRPPNITELGIFSVMWSEHCSYKNTRPLLKQFPTESDKVLVRAGEENAGVIDIGDGLGIAFKMESHNHPSAVEPFQGAATGVGGIIRDIFTMGARPICAMDSLRFGNLSSPEVQHLLSGVVGGIAHYGNCFGIPTIGGEACFDDSYEANPLINVFCLGVLHHEQVARGAAEGVGNPVFYVGPATGRDGLGGAAFASQDLTDESSEQQRGAVQVGDPFMEKLLVEACLELLATGCVAGIQDMGAAGLTCSTCETAARAGTGIEIELDCVPQRAPNMSPYEIMLSESQERMLIIVKQGHEATVQAIFDKWDLPWARIGHVTDTGRMVVTHHQEIVADIPAAPLANEAPVYYREAKKPAYLETIAQFSLREVPDTNDPVADLNRLLSWPNIASKNWIYRQYDFMVRDGSVVSPGSDAAVIRIKEDSVPPLPGQKLFTEKYLALTIDCNATHVYLDPYEGAKAAVAEAARNLACSGATPLGVTDNLNFGNPYKPEIFYQLKESIRGLSDACRQFETPVIGGNVSLYNQNPNGSVDPTPTVGMVGLIEKRERITRQAFQNDGDAILLIGEPIAETDPLLGMGGSAYLLAIHDLKTGTPPPCDPTREKAVNGTVLDLIEHGLAASAHDCSDGGLAVALAECCISEEIARGRPKLLGAVVDLSQIPHERLDALLFGESNARVLMSVPASRLDAAFGIAQKRGVAARYLGTVGGASLRIGTGIRTLEWDLEELHRVWWNALTDRMTDSTSAR